MKPSLQLHLSLIMAAALVALLFNQGGDWLRGGAIFFVSLLIAEILTISLMHRRLASLRNEGEAFEASLASISASEAESGALAALEQADDVELSEVSSPVESPAAVSALFTRYSRIVFPAGDYLELGSRQDSHVEVGRGLDGVRLIVREADGALFEWDGAGYPPPDHPPDYPTVYHWILKGLESFH